ncbi:MAG TPA: hypothetical protein VLE21_02825 [Candidatus Nitrosocosmicus sp.]|nr:hypothetical protein [Candidatus Nitrosocosmicus sp.]
MYKWLNKNSEVRHQNNSMSLSQWQVDRKDNFGEALSDIRTVAWSLDALLLWCALHHPLEFHRHKFIYQIFHIAKIYKKIQTKNTITKEIG